MSTEEEVNLAKAIAEMQAASLENQLEWIQTICNTLACVNVKATAAQMPNPDDVLGPLVFGLVIVSDSTEDLCLVLSKTPAVPATNDVSGVIDALTNQGMVAWEGSYWKQGETSNTLEPCIVIPTSSLEAFRIMFTTGIIS